MGDELIEDVLDDADEVFRFRRDSYFKERAHGYLRERRLCRGYDDTAVQCVVRDLVKRAYECGRADR